MSFSVGREVVCVNGVGQIKTGQIYKVSAIISCCSEYLGVGESYESGDYFKCHKCGLHKSKQSGLFAFSHRFRPLTDILNEQSEADLARIIEEVQKEITVEV